jgi:SSS family solute:Na+ symporter
VFATLDLVVFFGSLAAVMGIGLWASRREETSEDFFLAGRSVRWWGITGSIFGSNVSAAHLVGMLGIGFSIGFAQSHFELGAIAALMLLAYGFLPVYRQLGVFTLSGYLRLRYDGRSQTLYAVILLVVAIVQLTAGLYIGSRSLGLLLEGTPIELGYVGGVLALMVVTATYTIVGGLKAVIYTDVMQSVLLLFAGILVAALTFAQPEVGGWSGMMAWDAGREAAQQKMHLYLPSSHPDLPWTGALSGLLILHAFYWSTNQTIVQRALAARSDRDARLGIVCAGYLKLLIPFFAIAGGVAAAQLFEVRFPGRIVDPDEATPELIRTVVPAGFGLVGVIMAGLLGAILSSIDSLVNSASTLVTFDLYKRYWRPNAGDRETLAIGRIVLAMLLAVSALLAILTYDPSSTGNFFLRVSSQAGHFTPGLVVAFALGMFWRGATAAGAAASIASAPLFSFAIVWLYRHALARLAPVESLFGSELNFLHRAFVTVVFACLVHGLVSRATHQEGKAQEFTFFALRGESPERFAKLMRQLAAMAALWLGLGAAVGIGVLAAGIAAPVAAASVWIVFFPLARGKGPGDDLWWSGLLCSATLWILFWWF